MATNEPKKRRVMAQNSLFDTSDTTKNLIYIPMSDLMSSNNSNKKSLQGSGANIQKESKVDSGNKENEQLLLMQLPPKGLTIQDMFPINSISNGKNDSIRPRYAVRILGGKEESGSGSTASIVIEKTGLSYTLNKVETSNSLIVIPPNTSVPTNDQKRTKDVTNAIPKKYARLIANPSSSFLELKPRGLNRQHLWNTLNKHVYNPLSFEDDRNNGESIGISLNELTIRLHCSHKRMSRALEDLGAYQLPVTSNKRKQNDDQQSFPIYCTLDEEIEMSVMNAILSALVEMDDDMWLSNTSISEVSNNNTILEQDPLIERVIKYLSEEDNRIQNKIDTYKFIILHCLKKISEKNELKNDDIPLDKKNHRENTKEFEVVSSKKYVHFDTKKIAIVLAHQLFHSKPNPWPLDEFRNEWYRRMPGVGKAFEPSVDILTGVALHQEVPCRFANLSSSITKATAIISKNEGEDLVKCLKYFPESKLPFDAKSRFNALFREKEQWQFHELEPYIECLVGDDSNITKADLLLKYTMTVLDENKILWYRSR